MFSDQIRGVQCRNLRYGLPRDAQTFRNHRCISFSGFLPGIGREYALTRAPGKIALVLQRLDKAPRDIPWVCRIYQNAGSVREDFRRTAVSGRHTGEPTASRLDGGKSEGLVRRRQSKYASARGDGAIGRRQRPLGRDIQELDLVSKTVSLDRPEDRRKHLPLPGLEMVYLGKRIVDTA